MSSRKKKFITINSLNKVNAGAVAEYQKELLKLVRQMISIYTKELLAMYKDNNAEIKEIRTAADEDIADKYKKKMQQLDEVYQKYFEKYGQQKAETMVDKVAANQHKNFMKEYAKIMFVLLNNADIKPEDKPFVQMMKTQFDPKNFTATPEGKKAFMKAFSLNVRPYHDITETIKKTTITNNVELIKSIHQQYHREVSQSIYDVIVNGKPSKTVVEKLQQAGVKTKRRAMLIARDQVHKTHEALHLQELKQVGITKARWVHIGGGKTDRKTHITATPYGLNGGIFDITKGMYDPQVRQFIKPGELPFCHCGCVAVAEI